MYGFTIVVNKKCGEWEGIDGYDEEDTDPNSNNYETNEDGDCIIPDDEEYDWTRDPDMQD